MLSSLRPRALHVASRACNFDSIPSSRWVIDAVNETNRFWKYKDQDVMCEIYLHLTFEINKCCQLILITKCKNKLNVDSIHNKEPVPL